MTQIFIDKFIIPQHAEQEFTERMIINRDFIKNLPGFIKDEAYSRHDEAGNLVCITVASWQSEAALNLAKAAVQAEYERTGFNPAAMLARLNITMQRYTYHPMDN
ncbi:antibiotic biosynthesis monooxygenase [Mucilaginibacter sp. SP1R1]|uniref:antibiotic biosynthesis monooxygenase n=1 Tax=Mucilaginibacter sp. SP1R1 TaxID=2723091 RepID=UPI00161A1536|nr:antibiotic biosynthesis monooxygenase [Mucilaginibacter sp. SP1R1]MBB6151169.1 heme-degrading monooxygenase HmoA [Mucilaginibacter sp. SP1R1]